MTKSKKQIEFEQQIGELTLDLQRTRADFENYRKRVDEEKNRAREAGASGMIVKLLPVIDTIERAVAHVPEDLKENKWTQGVIALTKNLEKLLGDIHLERIVATPETPFDPSIHEAIQIDDDAEGEQEVIAEELQAGYKLGGTPIRPAMVKVTRK